MATSVDVPPFRTCVGHVEHIAFAPVDVDGLPWDMDTQLQLTQRVSADVDAVRRCCGLEHGAPLAVALEVTCDQTYWTARAVEPLPDGDLADVQLNLTIPPRTVAGRLRIEAVGLLAENRPGAAGVRGATRAGSRVATSGRSGITLEGGADQFPTAVVSFAKTGRVTSARWTVEYTYDTPDQPLLGTVRLLLNGDSTDVQRLMSRTSDAQGDRSSLGADLRRFLLGDLVRQALSDSSFEDTDVWPEESVGRTVQDVLDRYMEGRTLNQLRALQTSDRPQFEQLLQAIVPGSQDG